MPTDDDDLEKVVRSQEWYRDWVAKAIQQQGEWHKRLGNLHPEGESDE